MGADLIAHFSRLGSRCVELEAEEKLRIFHDFYRTGEETAFRFDISQTMRKGHDFKDFICPDTFEFEKDCFRMGDRYGRVIFLREYAAYIKDSMVAELCELNRNMMLSVDIIPVPTDEAVREVENRLLGVETNMTNIILTDPNADIIIIDPEREYSPLVKAMQGEVIHISATSENHINAMDMNSDYGDGANPVILKSEFILSLCEQLIGGSSLGAKQKSIIDRCTASVYRYYQQGNYMGTPPTLQDFREELLKQDEPEAQEIALAIELFTDGSLNTFAKHTNVDTHSRLICYDILDLGKQLQPIGMLGWLSIAGTNINYPVMQTPNNPNYYLKHNFEKEYSDLGTPYVQENCDLLTSDNLVIYGHHIKGQKMFGALENYKSKDFYEEHKTFRFDTLTKRGEYEIIAVFKTVAYSSAGFRYYDFVNAEDENDFNAYIAKCKELALYDTGVTAEYGDRLITLSTCEYSAQNGRLVVVAKKIA